MRITNHAGGSVEKKSIIRRAIAAGVEAMSAKSVESDSPSIMEKSVTEKFVTSVLRIISSPTSKGSPPLSDKYFEPNEFGNLVVTMKEGSESVNVGNLVEVYISKVSGKQVRVGFYGPKELRIGRFQSIKPRWRHEK